jgi:hypothetical protein
MDGWNPDLGTIPTLDEAIAVERPKGGQAFNWTTLKIPMKPSAE